MRLIHINFAEELIYLRNLTLVTILSYPDTYSVASGAREATKSKVSMIALSRLG